VSHLDPSGLDLQRSWEEALTSFSASVVLDDRGAFVAGTDGRSRLARSAQREFDHQCDQVLAPGFEDSMRSCN
jgi:hypothetical protein